MPVSGIRWGAVLARKGRGGFFCVLFAGGVLGRTRILRIFAGTIYFYLMQRMSMNKLLRGCLLGVVLLTGVGLSTSGLAAGVFFCLYALAASVTPLISGAISRRMPMDVQGATMGTVGSVHSLMGAVAPAFTTPMLMSASHNADNVLAGLPFFGAAALCLLAFVSFAAASRKLRSQERSDVQDLIED